METHKLLLLLSRISLLIANGQSLKAMDIIVSTMEQVVEDEKNKGGN